MIMPIVNIDDVELAATPAAFAASGDAAKRFDRKMGFIGARIGAQKLGYNVTELPPGKRAFPFHNHRVNEEMFFILSGKGQVRIGDQTYDIREGDIIACPPGGRGTAHQVVNTSDSELRYLAVSTMEQPELAEYPDSGKFAVLAADPDDQASGMPGFRFVGREGEGLDYWEGE